MKSVYACVAFFVLLTALITVNTMYLRNFFEETQNLIDSLPDSIEQLENMTSEQSKTYTSILEQAVDKWRSKERYMDVVLNHQTAGQISDKLSPAFEYLKSKDYESYLATLSEAKLLIKRMRQNESLSLDTIF